MAASSLMILRVMILLQNMRKLESVNVLIIFAYLIELTKCCAGVSASESSTPTLQFKISGSPMHFVGYLMVSRTSTG